MPSPTCLPKFLTPFVLGGKGWEPQPSQPGLYEVVCAVCGMDSQGALYLENSATQVLLPAPAHARLGKGGRSGQTLELSLQEISKGFQKEGDNVGRILQGWSLSGDGVLLVPGQLRLPLRLLQEHASSSVL